MPTYDYKCPKCGTEFKEFQKITAKAGARCPKCGAKAERQISGGAGLVFKGSGFYLTDYGRSGQKAGSDSKAGADSSESASTTAKPATEKPAAEKTADKPAKSKPKKKDD